MTPLDWGIVVAYCVLVLALGFWAQRKGAGDDTDNYFLSGRNLPWWIAGASMAASAFSVDTPIYVTKLTQGGGVQANWEWWFVGVSGILGAVVMARFWRRAGITTDLELITLRYRGSAAKALRMFRAVFFGLLFNPMGMALVVSAVIKVMGVVDPTLADENGWPQGDGLWIVSGIVLVAVTYSVMSGFMGVVLTDLAQFVVSIAGAGVMAYCAVNHPLVGGLDQLVARSQDKLQFLPEFGLNSATSSFAIFLGVMWWTFVNADGGGKFIQRLASCKNEVEAERATWFSTITFVALRSWPWILVALATLLIWPQGDAEEAYPRMMMELRPGLRGFVLASMIAAFMSTIDTQLNWGASYLVNDLIKPYLLPGRSERFYVLAARLCAIPTLLVVLVFFWVSSHPPAEGQASVLSVTKILRGVLMVSSGLGAIYLLRWFWWRLTATGEIAGMIASPLTTWIVGTVSDRLVAAGGEPIGFAPKVLIITFTTIASAAIVSLLLPVKDRSHLEAFVARVRPAGFWGDMAPKGRSASIGGWLVLRFVAGNAILFGLTFSIGGLLLQKGWLVVLCNGVMFGVGIGLDRWARTKTRDEPAQAASDDEGGEVEASA